MDSTSRRISNSEIQRAKTKAVGGKRKRCTKGKSCSAACVQATDSCLVEMPEVVNPSLSSVRSSIPKPRTQESLRREINEMDVEAHAKMKALNELREKHKELESKVIKLKLAKVKGEESKGANKEFKALDAKLKRDTEQLYNLVKVMGDKKQELENLTKVPKEGDKPKLNLPPPPKPKLAPSGNDIFSKLSRKEVEDWETDGELKAGSVDWGAMLLGGKRIGKGEYAEALVAPPEKVGGALKFKAPDGVVLKKGEIGDYEPDALKRVGQAGLGPRLIAARVSFQKAYEGDSALYNGMVAMERLSGTSLLKAIESGSIKDAEDIYWSSKAKLHKLGIAHNDSHANNFIITADGKGKFIDFGLSVISPKNALSEALGGPTGSDSQSSPRQGIVFNRIVKNLTAVRTEMANDGFSPNEINFLEKSGNKPVIVTGVPWQKMSDEQANKYLELLYKGV